MNSTVAPDANPVPLTVLTNPGPLGDALGGTRGWFINGTAAVSGLTAICRDLLCVGSVTDVAVTIAFPRFERLPGAL